MASRCRLPSIALCFLVICFALFLHFSILYRARDFHKRVGIISASSSSSNVSENPFRYDSTSRRRLSSKLFTKRAYTPASDEEWAKAIHDGCQYLRLMRADSETNAEIFSTSSIPKINKIPAQSPWSNPGDIEKWGWTITQDESKWIWSGFDWEDVRAPLETLELSTEIKDWDFVQTQHTKAWEVDGVHGPAIDQEYAFPGAKYQNFWLGRDQDASKYTLVLMGMFSPAGMVNEKTPPPNPKPNLPQLAAWSDMVYLQWYWTLSSLWKKPGINLDGSSEIPCPKQIIITSVITDSTRRILDRVRKNLREEPEGVAWPGDSFHPDSQAGMAILGSVHGRSLAWFLIQHKQQFGNKVFTSIHLFRKNEWRKTDKYQPLDYELYFEIGDVDEQDATGGAEIW